MATIYYTTLHLYLWLLDNRRYGASFSNTLILLVISCLCLYFILNLQYYVFVNSTTKVDQYKNINQLFYTHCY